MIDALMTAARQTKEIKSLLHMASFSRTRVETLHLTPPVVCIAKTAA